MPCKECAGQSAPGQPLLLGPGAHRPAHASLLGACRQQSISALQSSWQAEPHAQLIVSRACGPGQLTSSASSVAPLLL